MSGENTLQNDQVEKNFALLARGSFDHEQNKNDLDPDQTDLDPNGHHS